MAPFLFNIEKNRFVSTEVMAQFLLDLTVARCVGYLTPLVKIPFIFTIGNMR